MPRTSSRTNFQRFLSSLLLLSVVASSLALFIAPQRGHADATVIFLTFGSSWTVPSDWNSSDNTIEVIGGGGGGGTVGAPATSGAGGGGGGSWSSSGNGSDGGAGGLYGGGGGGGGQDANAPDGAGGIGAQGIIVITYTPTPFDPPSNLISTSVTGAVQLNWSAPASAGGSNLETYGIWRATSPFTATTSATLIASIATTSTTYSDTSVVFRTTYYYRVTATNASATSSLSNQRVSNANSGRIIRLGGLRLR